MEQHIRDFGDPCRPDFLKRIDTNSKAAMEDFYYFATSQMLRKPPPPLAWVKPADRQDAISELVIHCIKDNFAILRRYENQGKPFSGWLNKVAYFFFVDWLEKHYKVKYVALSDSSDEDKDVTGNVPDPLDPQRHQEFRELFGVVHDLIERIGVKCRELLILSSLETRPSEMVPLLQHSKLDNAQASNDLRHCQRKLAEMLRERGIDLADYSIRVR